MKYKLLLFSFLFIGSQSLIHADTKRVLFLGNSYTAYNNLPQIIADLASSVQDTLIFQKVTPGGYTLSGHSTNAASLSLIAQGGWDYVVLQEQSQRPSFPPSQFYADSYPCAMLLDSLIHDASPCAVTLFYQTWGRENGDQSNCNFYPPLCTYEGMDSMLTLRYREMAMDVEGMVSPVGQVWHAVRDLYYPAMQPYTSDGSHPSLLGSYIAATTFYTLIFEKDPSQLTVSLGLSPSDASDIRDVARAVVFDTITGHQFTDRSSPEILSFQTVQVQGDVFTITAETTGDAAYFWIVEGDTVGTSDTLVMDMAQYTSGSIGLHLVGCGGSDSDTYMLTSVATVTQPELDIYPCPVEDELYICTAMPWSSFQILDIIGQQVLYGAATDIIPVSTLTTGTYVLILRDDRGAALHRVFSVRK